MNKKGHACRQAGFTLIELLIVITIMMILTVITVAQFQSATRKANDVQRKADLSSVSKALLMYYADYNKFPRTNGGKLETFNADLSNDIIQWGGDFAAQGYDYMKVLPSDYKYNAANPSAWPQYCYVTDDTLIANNANPQKFALFAQLENGQDTDCHNPVFTGMTVCGKTNKYCYVLVSPNTSTNLTVDQITGNVIFP